MALWSLQTLLRCLKGQTNKIKYVTVFIFTKQHAYSLKELCSFSRDLAHGTRWTSPTFCKLVSITNGVTLLWTKTVLSDKFDISLPPSKSTGQTQFDVLRDEIVQIFLLFILPVSRAPRIETKLVNVTNLNRTLHCIKVDGRTLHFYDDLIL